MPLITYGLAEIGVDRRLHRGEGGRPAGGRRLALVALFVLPARRVPRPLLDVRLYARRTFAAASFTTFCLAAALFGAMILMPLYWQAVRQERWSTRGCSRCAGTGRGDRRCRSPGARPTAGGGPLAVVGVLVTALTSIPFGLIGAHTSMRGPRVWMFLRGVGIGFAFMPAMAAAFASLNGRAGRATPQMNVLQRLGGSIGTAVLAVVLSDR